jgi:hypothetical protein
MEGWVLMLSGALARVRLEDGWVVYRKSDRELHVRRPCEACVDNTPIGRDLTAIAGRWKDYCLYV